MARHLTSEACKLTRLAFKSRAAGARLGTYHHVLDLFSGTCTSAALYAPESNSRARVVCVDRDHSLKYIRGWIPKRYHNRRDINDDINTNTLLGIIPQKWPKASWKRFIGSFTCTLRQAADPILEQAQA